MIREMQERLRGRGFATHIAAYCLIPILILLYIGGMAWGLLQLLYREIKFNGN